MWNQRKRNEIENVIITIIIKIRKKVVNERNSSLVYLIESESEIKNVYMF